MACLEGVLVVTAEAWVLVALVAFLLVAFGLVVRWAHELADIAMRSLGAERHLRCDVLNAIADLDGSHYANEEYGDMCAVCGAADGEWPCLSRLVADDLRRAIGEGT